MVLAPEHPLVDRITPSAHRETVEAYRTQCAAKSERERMAEVKDKTAIELMRAFKALLDPQGIMNPGKVL